MKTIITIQHTQSVHHTNGMVGSWTDWELTEQGKTQARNIGRNLAEIIKGRRAVMYSSDLKRAAQTAELVAEALEVTPMYRQELRERNLGKCCGKSVKWLRENRETDEKTVDDRLFSDAESRRDEWNRLKPFYDEIMSGGEELILIVSHGDLLSVLNTMFAGLDVTSIDSFEMFGMAGGVSFLIESDEGKHIIKRMSDTSFMMQK